MAKLTTKSFTRQELHERTSGGVGRAKITGKISVTFNDDKTSAWIYDAQGKGTLLLPMRLTCESLRRMIGRHISEDAIRSHPELKAFMEMEES